MPGLLIKDLPPELHQKLKEEAARYHRSMTWQALVLLEQALSASGKNTAGLLPEPVKPQTPVSVDDVLMIIREHRDSDSVNCHRRAVLTLEQCRALLIHAHRFINDAQCEVDMEASLIAASKYGITGYDAQYVALAESLSIPLVSEGRKLRLAVPGVVISMLEFINGR